MRVNVCVCVDEEKEVRMCVGERKEERKKKKILNG